MKKTFSKVLSIALVVVLTGLMCITASATVLPGSGTMNDPYTISSAAELSAFSQAVADGNTFSGKFVVVENNIAADSSFKPIGTAETPFKGTFDGNGKELSDFDLDCDYAGLFAFTDGAVISDVSVTGGFYATNYAGAIVAYAKNTVIENCTVSAYVDATTYAGGIAGRIDSGKIVSCSTSSVIGNNTTEFCGGIAGYSAAEISDCTNTAYTEGKKNVGGIAGYAAADIISCTNTAGIRAVTTNLGGIAGLTEAAVKYCKNTGKIASSEKAGKVGGIAGVADYAEISECMNNGAVVAANSFAGGIVGYSTHSDITNCIATANVSNTGEYAGGIFGFILNGTASKCIFTALVTSAKNNTKAAIGAMSQGTVSDCYYNNSNSLDDIYSGKEAENTAGLTATDFTDAEKLSALDFSNVWEINTIHSQAYPLLVNIPFHTFKDVVSTEATCTQDGIFEGTCTYCHETVQKLTPAYGHTHMIVTSQNATCTEAGYKDVLCTVCSETDTIVLPATGHTDADTNNICDVCNADTTVKQPDTEKSFLQKIADFFNSIIEWISNLFASIFG